MESWTPNKRAVLAELVRNILGNYPRGRVLVAVDGIATIVTAPFADDLAQAFRLAGHTAFRSSVDQWERGRASIPPLDWSAGAGDALLVIDGTHLHHASRVGQWHTTVWLDAGTRVGPDAAVARYLMTTQPRALAAAIVDVTDPESPRRRFADSCVSALPLA